MSKHPAHTMPFDELQARLKAAREQRLLYERFGPDGLVLYVYSETCVYDGAWEPVTMAARGLILHPPEQRIVATPFPKFFNAGERGEPIPDLPFDVTEKLDGSLIIIFHHAGSWRTATKGSFDSPQALWAAERLAAWDLSALKPGNTYLAEATYPENRIVVRHTEPAMRLLAAYGPDGVEVPWADVVATASALGITTAKRLAFNSVADLAARAKTLPRDEEGYVLRFSNGLRLKIKGDEYKRIHALISGLTPLAMWEALGANMDMQSIRRDLPEEFWDDFDKIVEVLNGKVQAIIAEVTAAGAEMAGLSDKDVGLRHKTLSDVVRPLIFEFRKGPETLLQGRTRDKLFRMIRPTGNVLPGYQPSSAMNRIADEAG